MVESMHEKKEYDLKAILAELLKQQTNIEALYLFGSRAYRTGSLRSGIVTA
jgi:hypothetical protein